MKPKPVTAAAIEAARRELAEIHLWHKTLDQQHTALADVSGGALDFAPGGAASDSPVESVIERREEDLEMIKELETIAATWTWRGTELDGDPVLFMISRLNWAAVYLPISEDLYRINQIHQRTATHIPARLNRICPDHPESMTLLAETTGEKFYCAKCKKTWLVQQLDGAALAKIIEANPKVTVPLAGELLNIPPATIRQWYARGYIDISNRVVGIGDVFRTQMRQPRKRTRRGK